MIERKAGRILPMEGHRVNEKERRGGGKALSVVSRGFPQTGIGVGHGVTREVRGNSLSLR